MTIWKVDYEASSADLAETTFQWRFNGSALEGKTNPTFDDYLPELKFGGNLTCQVTIEDIAGRKTSKVSNTIVLPPTTVVDPPGQMDPPTLAAINEYEVQVTLAAPPTGSVSGYNLRWGIDNTNWNYISEITSPYILDTQLPNTLIYVQTSAFNPVGETYSNSATVVTPAIPNPNVPPLALADNKWRITDVGTGGDATLVIDEPPVDGGLTINALQWRKDGGTPISLTYPTSYPATFSLTNQFTDGVASLVDIRFGNPVGQGAWSLTKSITTTTQTTGSVANQSAEFGGLTLANAGRFRPVNNLGERVPLASNTPTRISGFGSNATIVDGGLAFTTNGAAINGDVWRCTLSTGGTVDITINWLADTYSVVTEAQITAALANNGNNGGRTIKMREGDINLTSAFYLFDGRNCAAPGLTITGSSSNYLAKQWGTRLLGQTRIRNCTNVTFRDFEIVAPGGTGNGASGLFKLFETTENVNFIRLGFRAFQWDYMDTTSGTTEGTFFGYNPDGINSASGNRWTGLIEECYGRDLYNFANLKCGNASLNACKFIANEWEYCSNDGVKISGMTPYPATPVEFRYNVTSNGFKAKGWVAGEAKGSESHNDVLHQFGGVPVGSPYFTNYTCIMNLVWTDDNNNQKNHQGIFSSGDGSTVPDQPAFTNPYIVGNIVVLGGNNPIDIPSDGGTIAFNTIVQPWTLYDTSDLPVGFELNQQQGYALAAPQVFCNIAEASKYLPSGKNNSVLGKAGATISYTTTFGSANNTRAAIGLAELKSFWTPVNTTRGALVPGLGTYGTPRDKSSWSFNSSFVEAARATYYP